MKNNGFPEYHFPLSLLFSVSLSMILRRKRDFLNDAQRITRRIFPPPIILNTDQLSKANTCLVTMNHYSRPGFLVIWAAAALSTALPRSPIWLMTSAWTKRGRGWDRLRTKLTKVLFLRIAEIYGFVTMPPMPPVQEETTERALSIRKLIEMLHSYPNAILCMAPEGRDFLESKLGIPYAGTGKLIVWLVKNLKRIQPVGVYEDNGTLIINFGNAYFLDQDKNPQLDDEMVIDIVMRKIGSLLPERLRGAYS